MVLPSSNIVPAFKKGKKQSTCINSCGTFGAHVYEIHLTSAVHGIADYWLGVFLLCWVFHVSCPTGNCIPPKKSQQEMLQ
jgi:hypothetical protein